jgi:hypothetical protein
MNRDMHIHAGWLHCSGPVDRLGGIAAVVGPPPCGSHASRIPAPATRLVLEACDVLAGDPRRREALEAGGMTAAEAAKVRVGNWLGVFQEMHR